MMTLLERLTFEGGFTMNPQGAFLNTNFGYQVGTELLAVVPIESVNNASFIHTVEQWLKRINNGEYLGAWADGGFIYLDRTVHETDYRLAMLKGEAHNQISIYDWKYDECIPCQK